TCDDSGGGIPSSPVSASIRATIERIALLSLGKVTFDGSKPKGASPSAVLATLPKCHGPSTKNCKDCRNRQRDCANQNAAGEQFCLDGIEQAAQGLCVNGRYPDGSQGPRARYLNYCVGPSTVRDVSTGQVTR